MSLAVIAKWIVPPLVGALIGYFTNLIAVKMLFFPHHAKYVAGHKVPFTPGVIPKSQSRIASAVGAIVAGHLVTEQDISERLLSSEIEDSVVAKSKNLLNRDIKNLVNSAAGTDGSYEAAKEKVSSGLADGLMDAVRNMNIPALIQMEGKNMAGSMIAQNPLLGMFLSEEVVDGLMMTIGQKLYEFIEAQGAPLAVAAVAGKADAMDNKTVMALLRDMGYDDASVDKRIREVYRNVAADAAGAVMRKIDIAAVVETRINEMPVAELEDGVLAVMKTELDMVVRLGALIGFILGCINLLI